MTSEQLTKYWIESSDEDFEMMTFLHESKRYAYSLFFGHLLLEKLFKALFAKVYPKTPYAPKIHDLLTLAQKCNLELDEEKENSLEFITTFNLSARYEDYKRDFNKQCTKEFTNAQINNIKELSEWLKKELTKE